MNETLFLHRNSFPFYRGVCWWYSESAACQKIVHRFSKYLSGHPQRLHRSAQHAEFGYEGNTNGGIDFGPLKQQLGKSPILQ